MEKQQKKVILIGRSMAGKTTLCQYINHEDLNYHKTQTVQLLGGNMIDTPGEYLERGYLRGALTVTAVDADIIILVQQANEEGTMFPPGYASTYAKPCIGIVTKSDLGSEKQVENAIKYLKLAGAGEVFVTSSYEGTGFEDVMEYFARVDVAAEPL